MAAVRNENQYINMGFNGRFLCNTTFLMFSGVLISFLWSICNLEFKLKSYDHFEGKKAFRIHTFYANINARMMSFFYVVIIFIFLFHITPLWLSGMYLINNNRVANSSCVPAVWSLHGCQVGLREGSFYVMGCWWCGHSHKRREECICDQCNG